jgi:glycosyltransferase involved in cell wall biosynthesis
MKVLLVTPSFHPAVRYGGPTHATWTLARSLGARGIEVRVLTTNAHLDETLEVPVEHEHERAPGVRVTYLPRLRGQLALGLAAALRTRVAWADVVHLGAVYNATTFPTLLAARRAEKPLFWTPFGAHYHALRSPTVRRPHLKAIWDRAARALLDPARTVLLAASAIEAEASRARMPGVRVVVVPRGVEVPSNVTRDESASGPLRFLFLGRLDPLKGLERVLSALASSDATLTVAGSGAHEATLRRAVAPLGERVRWLGQVSDADKPMLFASHDLLVLPSLRESFGIAVAEALAHGLPALVTRPTAWEHLEAAGAGLVVEPSSLAETLAFLDRARLERMRGPAHVLASRSLDAGVVAERMIGLDRKSTRLNSSHRLTSRMPSSA